MLEISIDKFILLMFLCIEFGIFLPALIVIINGKEKGML